MAIVIGVFLVFLCSKLQCDFQIVFTDHIEKLCNVYHLYLLIVALNSAVNPLAYAIFKRDIKKELKRLICFVILQKRSWLV